MLLDLLMKTSQQRFYQLRFMWIVIQCFENLGMPTREVEEMRGLYQSFAEGVSFSDHINQQKGADTNGQPLDS